MAVGPDSRWSPWRIGNAKVSRVPRSGPCDPHCTRCGEVCPTGAIASITADDRRGSDGREPIRIGTAFYDRGRCLPWAMNTPCIVCEEMCPTSPKAIWLEATTVWARDGRAVEVQQPFVDPELCTGCGLCERACPEHPKAIHVIAERNLVPGLRTLFAKHTMGLAGRVPRLARHLDLV